MNLGELTEMLTAGAGKEYLLHTDLTKNEIYLRLSEAIPELSWRQGHSDMEGPYISASSLEGVDVMRVKIYFNDNQTHEVAVLRNSDQNQETAEKLEAQLNEVGRLEIA